MGLFRHNFFGLTMGGDQWVKYSHEFGQFNQSMKQEPVFVL